MLKIPKKQLYIARTMRYCGIILAVFTCIMSSLITSYGVLIVLIFAFVALTVAGEQMIRSLYKCPKCENRLLPYKSRNGFEKSCPEFCPHCGERIVVKIVDNNDQY